MHMPRSTGKDDTTLQVPCQASGLTHRDALCHSTCPAAKACSGLKEETLKLHPLRNCCAKESQHRVFFGVAMFGTLGPNNTYPSA